MAWNSDFNTRSAMDSPALEIERLPTERPQKGDIYLDEDGNEILVEVPFIEKSKAIENLEKAEPNLSEYFRDHGGIKSIADDLIYFIKDDPRKYIYIDPLCADNCFNYDEYLAPMDKVLEICKGNMKVDKSLLERPFQFAFLDDNGKPYQFKSRSDIAEIHLSGPSQPIDDFRALANYYALVGCYESEW